MTRRFYAPAAFLFAAFVLMAGLVANAAAQEATPAADGAMAHPAHIHTGTCDTLGDVVYPLENVAAPDMTASPEASPEAAPVSTPITGEDPIVAQSTTTVDVALDDLLAEEHAINLHESEAEIQNYIACGDVTGTPEDGSLDIDLLELNDSGYRGAARLVDNGDETTTVLILLTQVDAGTPEADATPEAESAPAADADAVTVEISDFTFGPETVTIPVGGSVTWTNLDTAPHTATAQDREQLQSGTLGQGESFTQTFDTAGTYEYFCEFHGNMSGTVIVE